MNTALARLEVQALATRPAAAATTTMITRVAVPMVSVFLDLPHLFRYMADHKQSTGESRDAYSGSTGYGSGTTGGAGFGNKSNTTNLDDNDRSGSGTYGVCSCSHAQATQANSR